MYTARRRDRNVCRVGAARQLARYKLFFSSPHWQSVTRQTCTVDHVFTASVTLLKPSGKRPLIIHKWMWWRNMYNCSEMIKTKVMSNLLHDSFNDLRLCYAFKIRCWHAPKFGCTPECFFFSSWLLLCFHAIHQRNHIQSNSYGHLPSVIWPGSHWVSCLKNSSRLSLFITSSTKAHTEIPEQERTTARHTKCIKHIKYFQKRRKHMLHLKETRNFFCSLLVPKCLCWIYHTPFWSHESESRAEWVFLFAVFLGSMVEIFNRFNIHFSTFASDQLLNASNLSFPHQP